MGLEYRIIPDSAFIGRDAFEAMRRDRMVVSADGNRVRLKSPTSRSGWAYDAELSLESDGSLLLLVFDMPLDLHYALAACIDGTHVKVFEDGDEVDPASQIALGDALQAKRLFGRTTP